MITVGGGSAKSRAHSPQAEDLPCISIFAICIAFSGSLLNVNCLKRIPSRYQRDRDLSATFHVRLPPMKWQDWKIPQKVIPGKGTCLVFITSGVPFWLSRWTGFRPSDAIALT